MSTISSTTTEFVNPACLEGLEILKEHKLVVLAAAAAQADIFGMCIVQPGDGVLPDNAMNMGDNNNDNDDDDDDNNNDDNSSEVDPKLQSSWKSSNSVITFDPIDGSVVSLDLGGKRLHQGLHCDPAVFGRFRKLQTLNLAGTDLPLTDILSILNHLPNNTITGLFLGGNCLGCKGATAIATSSSFQKTLQGLTKLDLRYNDIGSEGMRALCTGLQQQQSTKSTTLQYLYLEGNTIGDDGCLPLGDLLSGSSSCPLRELYLGQNQIGPRGAEYLAEGLRSNTALTKLYLEGNRLGADGATAFCDLLEQTRSPSAGRLVHLYTDNNNIGKDLSNRLAKALKSQTTIPDICG